MNSNAWLKRIYSIRSKATSLKLISPGFPTTSLKTFNTRMQSDNVQQVLSAEMSYSTNVWNRVRVTTRRVACWWFMATRGAVKVPFLPLSPRGVWMRYARKDILCLYMPLIRAQALIILRECYEDCRRIWEGMISIHYFFLFKTPWKICFIFASVFITSCSVQSGKV